MLGWAMQVSIISLLLILLLHYLFIFFKTNLTSPKTTDLVYNPQKQYEELFDTLKNNAPLQNNNDSTSSISLLPNYQDPKEMKEELKNFLKDIKSNKQSNKSNGNPAFGENNFPLPSQNSNNNTMNQANISYDANAFSSAYSSY